VADFSQIVTFSGPAYVAVVEDVWSRYCLGHAVRATKTVDLVLAALEMAIWRRGEMQAAGAVHHSDHGQYTSFAFSRRLVQAGLHPSMGSVGDALDAMCESLIGTLKIERLDRRTYRSVDDVATDVFDWIESWYNRRRRHTSLGMISPLEYESQHHKGIPSPTREPQYPRFGRVAFLDSGCLGCGVDVVQFKFDRRQHAETRVASPAVVEDLDVFEDRVRELDPGLPAAGVEQFDLRPRPERLDHRVVIAVTNRSHRGEQPRLPRPVGERPGGELGAVIGMDDRRHRSHQGGAMPLKPRPLPKTRLASRYRRYSSEKNYFR
jgi:hypothetical protein